MRVIEVPVSTNNSMLPNTRVGASRRRPIRIAMCCVLMLLVTLTTPWDVGASPSPVRQATSSPMYAAAPPDNDGDGIPDEMDMDDDDDGVLDDMDEDPFNAPPVVAETPDIIAPDQDSDNDGIDNIMDPDDDNDVIEDDEDPAPFTPVPSVDTPVPPTEIPEVPAAEEPAPAQPEGPDVVQPDKPEVQRNAPPPPARPATDEQEPFAVQSRPQDTAPLVVALPSTGSTGDVQPDSSRASILAVLAVALGGSGLLIHRRSNRPAAEA